MSKRSNSRRLSGSGGRIELYQCGESKARRGWLQGRFKVRLLSVIAEELTGASLAQDDDRIQARHGTALKLWAIPAA